MEQFKTDRHNPQTVNKNRRGQGMRASNGFNWLRWGLSEYVSELSSSISAKFLDQLGINTSRNTLQHTRMYPKVSGLAAWSENYKYYSSLPVGAVESLFCESV
jgi:hypothetical protein